MYIYNMIYIYIYVYIYIYICMLSHSAMGSGLYEIRIPHSWRLRLRPGSGLYEIHIPQWDQVCMRSTFWNEIHIAHSWRLRLRPGGDPHSAKGGDRGTFWELPLTSVTLPKSARAKLFPQSDKIDYVCSGPISVFHIPQRGVQWKQGVVVCIML